MTHSDLGSLLSRGSPVMFFRFKFLELYYRRGETTHKGKPIAARVETVVIYVPDVWNCVPTQLEWDGLTVNYQKMFNAKTTKPVEETAKSTEDDKANTPLSLFLYLSSYFCFEFCACLSLFPSLSLSLPLE